MKFKTVFKIILVPLLLCFNALSIFLHGYGLFAHLIAFVDLSLAIYLYTSNFKKECAR